MILAGLAVADAGVAGNEIESHDPQQLTPAGAHQALPVRVVE